MEHPVSADGVTVKKFNVKVAVQVLFAAIVTCPLTLQSPLQPEKVDPVLAVAMAVAVEP